MKLVKAKKPGEIDLAKISSVEFETNNKSLVAVHFLDPNGKLVVRVAKADYCEIQALVPAPPETKDVFRVTAKNPQLDVNLDRVFEGQYEAQHWADSFGSTWETTVAAATVEVQE